MKMYRASWLHAPRIEEYEVEKTTEKTVTYQPWSRGRPLRETKLTDDHGWFDTFDEAKVALVTEFVRKVKVQEDNLKRSKDRLGNALGIREATEAL